VLRIIAKGLLYIFLMGFILLCAITLIALPKPKILSAPKTKSHWIIANAKIVDVEATGRYSGLFHLEIRNNRIHAIHPAGSIALPPNIEVVDIGGRYVMPGLWDSHMHTLRLSPQLHMPLLIANGVTHIRDMGDTCSWSAINGCKSPVPDWQKDIQNGEILGPQIVTFNTYHLEEAPEADADLQNLIALLKRNGEPFIKVQLDEQIAAERFDRVLTFAAHENMKIAGHVPASIDITQSMSHWVSVEHDWSLLPQCSKQGDSFDGRIASYAKVLHAWDDARCHKVLTTMAMHSVVYVPTHVASSGQDVRFAHGRALLDQKTLQQQVILPQRLWWQLARSAGEVEKEEAHYVENFHRAALKLSKQALDAGVPVLAGSDALDPDVAHGLGLHHELEYLVVAGFTPLQALQSATSMPAKVFGFDDRYGSVETGKHADLLILDANPLVDIRNTQRIHVVVVEGRLLDAQEREKALAFVSEQNASWSVNARFLSGLWRN
jgi:hypothetical protein